MRSERYGYGGPSNLLLESKGYISIILWLTVPWPFNEGEIFEITLEGNNVNLRETTSLNGKILKILSHGDRVTIIGGPSDKDGYTWWKILTEDGKEGWAVNIPEWYTPVELETTPTP